MKPGKNPSGVYRSFIRKGNSGLLKISRQLIHPGLLCLYRFKEHKPAGRSLYPYQIRQEVEDRTDEYFAKPFAVLSKDEKEELEGLMGKLAEVVAVPEEEEAVEE